MVHRKRILVLESDQLLAAGIVSLLSARSEFSVTRASGGSLEALSPLDAPLPDVVILEEGLLATNLSAVVRLSDHHPTLRLIVFRLRDNTVQIFDKHVVQVGRAADFINLL